jgi:phage major head subunit gpT-like protein
LVQRPSTAVDISEAALEQAVIDMGKWLDDRGLKIATRPQKLIIPIDLDFEANKIMKTEYEVGTANNTVNLVRSRFPGGSRDQLTTG